MTFDEYISNPMGRKNAVFSGREMFRTMYREKLDAILVREVGKVKYKLFTSNNGKYYVHFKIPSEPIKEFYYDTVIEFYTDQHGVEISSNLKKYYVKFYSNDPSFVFTFAHAMKANDMLIKDLEPKMSKQALKNIAEEKNPKDEVGYVKSIFFAYLLMQQYNLFDKSMFKLYGEKYSKSKLLDDVEHADKKIEDRIEEGNKLSKDKKVQKQKERRQKELERRKVNPINIDPISSVSKTNNVSHVNKTQSKVKKIKKVKKI